MMSIRKVGCAFLKQKSEEQTQIILVIDSFNCFFKKLNVEIAVQLHGKQTGSGKAGNGRNISVLWLVPKTTPSNLLFSKLKLALAL